MTTCNTPPQTDVRTTSNTLLSGFHGLHSKHETEALVLHQLERFGEDVSSHVIRANEQESDRLVRYAFTNEVISDINMLCCHMIDGVMRKEVSSPIVNVQCGRLCDILSEL